MRISVAQAGCGIKLDLGVKKVDVAMIDG